MVQQATVMVVDDDQAMTSTLAKILGAGGYSVVTAKSGDAALAILRQDCPDLVIADLKMNGMSGHELQSEIARRSDHHGLWLDRKRGGINAAWCLRLHYQAFY
jgi:CheY-like chemotaxis protein